MPSLDIYKRQLMSSGSAIGQQAKYNSDLAMEYTWDNDLQSKICYIYDQEHDDDPDLEYGFDYRISKKHKIKAKFIITQYSTLSKDQVEYHLMFLPSEKMFFDEHDDLYWYEKNYRKQYGMQYPVGLYIDIPDEKNIYRRWLICSKEIGNQFEKYSILPCDYRFQWIDVVNGKKIKKQSWGCTRSMNSYTAGFFVKPKTISPLHWETMQCISFNCRNSLEIYRLQHNIEICISVNAKNYKYWTIGNQASNRGRLIDYRLQNR